MKLIDAAKQAGVQRFVLQTSLLTNGAAIGQGLNPVYIFLNLATGALSKKLETELYVKQSGLDYTIVRCKDSWHFHSMNNHTTIGSKVAGPVG